MNHVLYSRPDCSDCDMARRVLAAARVNFVELDIREDEQARQRVMLLIAPERLFVPVIQFLDGSFLIEPTEEVLKAKLAAL